MKVKYATIIVLDMEESVSIYRALIQHTGGTDAER